MIESQTIDRLIRLKGDGVPVLSLYVAVDAKRSALPTQLASLLDQVRPLAYDESLPREARLSVREDIRQIEQAAGADRWGLGTVGLFSCSARGVFEEVALPRALPDRVVVDDAPWLRPMLAVLDEYHRTCVVAVDRAATRVWELYQGEMRELAAFRDPVLRKGNYAAGRSENHVAHKDEELTKRHYQHTVDVLDQLRRTGGFDLLVVGGRGYEVPRFMDFFPAELRRRVAGTFTLGPGGAATAEVRRHADAVLDRYERDEERHLVEDVLRVRAQGGPAAVGLPDCLWAGSVAAVQSLLIQDAPPVAGVVCDHSAWFALAGPMCPLCGRSTRPTADVVTELVAAVIEQGGAVKQIRADTELAAHGAAARLRFPLPIQPTV